MRSARNIAGLGAALSLSALGVASADPPTAYQALHLPDGPAVQRPSPVIHALAMGALRIELEHTPLAKVRKIYGGDIHPGGDAGQSVTWLCYVRGDPDGDTLVYWFLSNNEMGGGKVVTQVALQKIVGRPDSRCHSAPAQLTRFQMDAPAIGARLKAVKRHFGGGVLADGYVSYENTRGARTVKDAYTTTTQVVSYHFTNGVVDTVSASQVTAD